MSMVQTDAISKLFSMAIEQSEDSEEQELLAAIQEGSDNIEFLERLLVEDEEELTEEESRNLSAIINDMKLPAKIKLAMLGGKPARGILIRDTNKQVPLFVLQNPKLTESEVNEFAKNTNLSELVLREINKNSTWMKNYAIKCAITSNPKTPIDCSIKWLKHLRDKDLRNLAKSKNIPKVIATQSNKIIQQRQKKPGGGGGH